jgi:hypothetical protein
MSDEKNKKTERTETKTDAQAHQQSILDLVGGLAGINKYIDGFDNIHDQKMTEGQKQYMRDYASQITERWSKVMCQVENAIKDPGVIDELEKKLRVKKSNKEK